MQDSNVPPKFPIPFGNSAGAGYIRPIPTASQIGITNGAASLTDGFPPDTFVPVASGGVPPFGQDFNGLLNQITAWSRWQQAGGPVYYDATFSAAIGGYPKGTVLSSATLGGLWLSLVDNNTSDPDTGGANWQSLLASGTSSANPTAQVGNAVINGVATTFMRSDAAPPLSSGAAAVNVGTLGGVLTGTLPNPGMAAGAAVANIGYTPYNATNPAGYITGNNLFTTITRYTSPTRSISATYTNSTGKPLQVVVSFPISSGGTATFSINGAGAGYWSYNSSTGATLNTSFTAIIPNGATYELSGPLSFNDWTEAV